MRIRVNPNRMEYSKLKRKLALASRGHKLLKDKQDGLMQEFFKVVRASKKLRIEIEEKIGQYYISFIEASMLMSRISLYEALMFPKFKVEPDVSLKNKMGVKVPVFKFDVKEDAQSYGYLATSGQLDRTVEILQGLLPKLIDLAGMEKQIELMAYEIERTRRRVNTLEHVLIPNLKETIKYIAMKLGENERAVATRLMRVKSIVRKSS
ncbi:V-type ATP synthase subunit D [Candidatus Margulisiibacteriota bacterium]